MLSSLLVPLAVPHSSGSNLLAPHNLTHASHRSRLHQPVATTAWLTAQGCPTIVKGALFNHISKRGSRGAYVASPSARGPTPGCDNTSASHDRHALSDAPQDGRDRLLAADARRLPEGRHAPARFRRAQPCADGPSPGDVQPRSSRHACPWEEKGRRPWYGGRLGELGTMRCRPAPP